MAGTKKPSEAETAELEAKHGPLVFIDHPDGSCFGFMVLTREMFNVREARARRGDRDADERMLQERCVWPSREAWNAYVEAAAFETVAYIQAYRQAFGGKEARACDADEIPDGADPSLRWLTNGERVFAFRKPGRAEIKQFGASVVAERRSGGADPLEVLLSACASSATGGPDPVWAAWVSSNPFGVGTFGNAFVSAYGMTEARVTGK